MPTGASTGCRQRNWRATRCNELITFPKLDIAPHRRDAFVDAIKKGHPLAAPTACPPPTVDAAGLSQVLDGVGFLIRTLFSLTDRFFDGDPLVQARELGLPQDLQDCLQEWNRPELFDQARWFQRPDLLLTQDGFKAVEINVGPSLGGPGVCDVHAQTFRDWFGIEEGVPPGKCEPLGANWIAGILAKLRTHNGTVPDRPTFCSITPNASIDLRDDFSLNDLQTLMGWHGINYIYGSAEDLTIKRNGVWLDGQKIDIVFTDFCYSNFIRTGGNFETISRLIDCYVNKGVLFLSPPHHTIFDQKSLFVHMTDPAHKDLYTTDEWDRLAKHLPRTHLLEPRLRDMLIASRADWIIKPKYDYGGHSVVMGTERSPADWDAALASAINADDDFVVQRIVTDQLRIHDPNLKHDRQCCFGPLMNFGSYIGCFYRDVQLDNNRSLVINAVAGARYASIRVEDRP